MLKATELACATGATVSETMQSWKRSAVDTYKSLRQSFDLGNAFWGGVVGALWLAPGGALMCEHRGRKAAIGCAIAAGLPAAAALAYPLGRAQAWSDAIHAKKSASGAAPQ